MLQRFTNIRTIPLYMLSSREAALACSSLDDLHLALTRCGNARLAVGK